MIKSLQHYVGWDVDAQDNKIYKFYGKQTGCPKSDIDYFGGLLWIESLDQVTICDSTKERWHGLVKQLCAIAKSSVRRF